MTTSESKLTDLQDPSVHYLILHRSGTSNHFWKSRRELAAVIVFVLPIIILGATLLDGTIWLSEGRGLSNHHGFWIIFVTTPGLILLCGALLDRFMKLLHEPETYLTATVSSAQLAGLQQLARDEVDGLCLKSRARYVLFLCVIVGLSYFILNIVQTWEPSGTYGHDVFDAWTHRTGYFATKAYLLPVFTVVYPIAIFVALHITLSMVHLLFYLCENDVLEISYFHQDNCGGTSCFGELNLFVMGIYTLLFAVLAGMWLTHDRTYFVTQSALLFCSVATTFQSVAAVWAIHKFVSNKKRARLVELTQKLNDDLRASLVLNTTFRNELLVARNHVAAIHTFPYAQKMGVAVAAFRFAPAVVAIIGFAVK